MKIHFIRRASAALASLLICATSYAAECSLIPDGLAHIEDSDRADLLNEIKFAALNREWEKQHQQNLRAEGGDLLTLRQMLAMQSMADDGNKLARMWADQQPHSFFAQLNAGIYYANQAESARGNKAANQVSANQWEQVRRMRDLAAPYLNKAMALDPQSALPQNIWLGLARMEGTAGGKTPSQWLDTATQADPKNMAARITAINYMSPRWGGTFEALEQMVSQASARLSKKSAHYLQYNLVLAKASHYETFEGDRAKAQEFYKQASNMCQNSETARKGILRMYQ